MKVDTHRQKKICEHEHVSQETIYFGRKQEAITIITIEEEDVIQILEIKCDDDD